MDYILGIVDTEDITNIEGISNMGLDKRKHR